MGNKVGEKLEIKHTSSVIYAKLPDGSKAYIAYEVREKVMRILETYTPPQYRGRGIASKLMEYAVKLAVSNEWLIEPVCSYAIYYFIKHPELRERLVHELRRTDLVELHKQRLREEAMKRHAA